MVSIIAKTGDRSQLCDKIATVHDRMMKETLHTHSAKKNRTIIPSDLKQNNKLLLLIFAEVINLVVPILLSEFHKIIDLPRAICAYLLTTYLASAQIWWRLM